MAAFSIQEMAFTGFRVVREHPGFLAIWAFWALIMSVVCGGVLIGLGGADLMRIQQLIATGGQETAVGAQEMGKLLPIYIMLTPFILIFYSVIYAAMNRAVLRPDDLKFGYLKFGRDEVRQIGLMLLLFLSALGVYVVFLLGAAIVVLLAGLAHIAALQSGLVVVLVFFAVFGFLAVRMSLASALTFQTGRVNLFGSWALTRGHFWPLFGVYTLTFALSAVVIFLTYLVTLAAVAVVAGGDSPTLAASPDIAPFSAYFTAPHLVQLVLGAAVSALVWPIVLTPPAAVYRRLMIGQPAFAHAVST